MRGEIDVIIGPRSALFTPFSNLGLIVIDEEHEMAYKSEQTPSYHARQTAIHIAQTKMLLLCLALQLRRLKVIIMQKRHI